MNHPRFDVGPQIRQAIKDNPPMTREEEVRVGRLARDGDKKARERLVLCNLGIVLMCMQKRLRKDAPPTEDLVQYGVLGLIRAADKFNPELGWRFNTYALHWINAILDDGIGANEQIVRLPKGRAHRWARKQGGEIPTVVLSLDASMNDDSDMTFLDALPSGEPSAQDELEHEERLAAIRARLHDVGFTAREIDIIESRLMADPREPLHVIGDRYGICRERIRQLQQKLLPRLRKHFRKLAA
jgi:RNA polymerase sigma factor (sigma-70 family)